MSGSVLDLLPGWLGLGGAGLLLAAAVGDVMTRRISNLLPAGLALLGLADAAVQGRLPSALGCALAVLACAVWGWRRGWMGGGDVKLLAATALLLPPGRVPGFLLAVALAGGVLSVLVLLARAWLRRHPGGSPLPLGLPPGLPLPLGLPLGLPRRVLRIEAWRVRRGAPLPYACAIAAGFLLAQG